MSARSTLRGYMTGRFRSAPRFVVRHGNRYGDYGSDMAELESSDQIDYSFGFEEDPTLGGTAVTDPGVFDDSGGYIDASGGYIDSQGNYTSPEGDYTAADGSTADDSSWYSDIDWGKVADNAAKYLAMGYSIYDARQKAEAEEKAKAKAAANAAAGAGGKVTGTAGGVQKIPKAQSASIFSSPALLGALAIGAFIFFKK